MEFDTESLAFYAFQTQAALARLERRRVLPHFAFGLVTVAMLVALLPSVTWEEVRQWWRWWDSAAWISRS